MSEFEPFPDFFAGSPELNFDEFIDFSGGDNSSSSPGLSDLGSGNDDSGGGLDEANFDDGLGDFDFSGLADFDFNCGLGDFSFGSTGFISSPGFDEVGNTGPADPNDFALNDVSFAAARPQQPLPPQQPSPPQQPYPRKSKAFDSSRPCKLPRLDVIGPIEAMWSPMARGSGGQTPSLKTPSPGQHRTPDQHYRFSPFTPPGSCPSNPIDLDALPSSPSESLDQNPNLVYGTPHHNTSPAFPSSTSLRFINMAPSKKGPKRNPKPKQATASVAKVTKKTKATPKKVQAPLTPAATPVATPAASPERLRSVEGLLSVPFITLNAQEKIRVLLPLLRGMDPRLLEQNLGELRGIQAMGPGHEKVVASRILNSSDNQEADDILASELTGFNNVHNTPRQQVMKTPGQQVMGTPPQQVMGTPPHQVMNTPRQQMVNTPHQQVMGGERVSFRETSPLAYKSAGAETEGQLGAMRQREALVKAAVLKTLGRTR
jgi:hypothetical protein